MQNAEEPVIAAYTVDAIDEHGSTALGLAALECEGEIAWKLVQAGADPTHLDEAGNSVLHIGAYYCSEEMRAGPRKGAGAEGAGEGFARALFSSTDAAARDRVVAAVDLMSPTGRSPLHLAAKQNSYGFAMELLARGADPSVASDVDQETPVELARKWGHDDLLEALRHEVKAHDARGDL